MQISYRFLRTVLAIQFSACLLPVTATAQQNAFERVFSTEPCGGYHTFSAVTYSNFYPSYRHFELQIGCYDPSGPQLTGPEPLAGFVSSGLVTEEGGMYEIPSTAAESFLRTGLAVGKYTLITDDRNMDEVLSLKFGMREQRSTRHPELENVMGQGIAFRAALSETSLPDRDWIGSWTFLEVDNPARASDLYEHYSGSEFTYYVGFQSRGGQVTGFTGIATPGQAGAAAQIALSGGAATGTFAAEIQNIRPPEIRDTRDWDSIRVNVHDLNGYLVGSAADPLLQLYGFGTLDYTGRAGQMQRITTISLSAAPLPEGKTLADWMRNMYTDQ